MLSAVRSLTEGGVEALCQVEDGEDLALKSHNVLWILDRALVKLREGRVEALQSKLPLSVQMQLATHIFSLPKQMQLATHIAGYQKTRI